VRVRFTPEAINSAREKHAWWIEHRQEAPRLFADELSAVIARLRAGDDHARRLFAVRAGRQVWRLLMPRTKLHVYYRFDLAGDVEILLLWNATAGSLPPLPR
jgi:hypothetical protein